MKTKLILSAFLSFVFCLLSFSQVPQGFNYQAIARTATGDVIPNQSVRIKVAIQTSAGSVLWDEEHLLTTSQFGLVTFIVGTGPNISGTVSNFSMIDWNAQTLFLKTSVQYPVGSTYVVMGTTQIWSVPYSLVAKDVEGPIEKLGIQGNTDLNTEALFEVKNKSGQTVFAVYNEGVRVYVSDGSKGLKGGFAVGGFGTEKAGESTKYLFVDKDSVRIYLDTNPLTKAVKGGFAVGGYDLTKGTDTKYFNVETSDNEVISPSQNRVLWYPLKNAFLTGRVLVEKSADVGQNSFASGYEARAGGDFSQSMGYKTNALGSYSSAIGNNAVAEAINSFAFGYNAYAKGQGSYAIGTNAEALGNLSLALGSVGVDSLNRTTGKTKASGYGAIAIGFGSVSLGQGSATLGVEDTASGDFSSALGYRSVASGWGSSSLGYGTHAKGIGSVATGWGSSTEPTAWFGWGAMANNMATKASNFAATSFGDRTLASGHTSLATGYMTTASGHLASTFGDATTATGDGSVAMGHGTTAQAYGSLVIGRYNTVFGNAGTWNYWDPEFIIGNGTSSSARSNAFVFYNSGIADFAGFINLNTSQSFSEAIKVRNSEALWYDGTYFSWGFGGTYNVFARPVSVATTVSPGSYGLYVNGSVYASGGWAGSDVRWKKDLEPLQNNLSEVLKLQGFRYNWRTDDYPEMHFDRERQIGLIAQDVEKIFPELVKTDDKGYKAVSYEKLTVILLEGMKEQQKQIDAQNERIEKLEKMVGRKRASR